MMIIKMIILDTYPVNNCMYFCIGTYHISNLFYCIPHVFLLISTYMGGVEVVLNWAIISCKTTMRMGRTGLVEQCSLESIRESF